MNQSPTSFDLSGLVEIARTWSQVADQFEAKFHYAILVADLQRAGIWPIMHYLARRSATSLGPVCDQGSIMGFGFYRAAWSVSQSVMNVSPVKMAEPIKMPFGMQTQVGPRNHALDGVNIPYANGQF